MESLAWPLRPEPLDVVEQLPASTLESASASIVAELGPAEQLTDVARSLCVEAVGLLERLQRGLVIPGDNVDAARGRHEPLRQLSHRAGVGSVSSASKVDSTLN